MALSVPRIAVIAAGAMGAAVAKRLKSSGCTVLTNLDGRSEATRRRAADAGMDDVSLRDIALRADCVLSILPPKDAVSFAEKFLNAYTSNGARGPRGSVTFADCNAVNPETVKRIAGLFHGSEISFVDSGIIGGPPREGYDPTFYVSADDPEILKHFCELGKYGLKISPLVGEGVGVGDASALKMSYAGITKGLTGLLTTMILAANASSPATASALAHELHLSQPVLLERITTSILPMLPKAYRWGPEMEEISGFVGGPEGTVYAGMARLYERTARSVAGKGNDVEVLINFVEEAKKLSQKD